MKLTNFSVTSGNRLGALETTGSQVSAALDDNIAAAEKLQQKNQKLIQSLDALQSSTGGGSDLSQQISDIKDQTQSYTDLLNSLKSGKKTIDGAVTSAADARSDLGDLSAKSQDSLQDVKQKLLEDLIPKLETQISRIGKKLIREQWDELLLKGGYAAAQMIPEISRVYIQLNADRFIKKGKRPEDLIYQPQFHFADMKWEFSDWMFLEYLSNPQRAAELFAQKWLLEKLPEFSKKEICIGCIREEMEEMLKKTGTGPEVSLPRSA